jgi:hypothetical protein
MALTLVSTLGAEDANSYVDVAYCDTYWLEHYQTDKASQWSALSAPQKASALVSACRVIEKLRFTYPYDPYKAASSYEFNRSSGLVIELVDRSQPFKASYHQALQFPRNKDREKDTADLFIPEAVKTAQCEQAVYLLTFDETAVATRLQGIESESTGAGPVNVSQKFTAGGSALSPMALDMLSPFLISSSKKVRRG